MMMACRVTRCVSDDITTQRFLLQGTLEFQDCIENVTFFPLYSFLSQCAFTGELKIKMHSSVRTERQGRWKGIFETTRMAFDWVIIQCLIKEYIRIWLVITFLAAAASACCCSCCWRFWLLLLDGAKRSANRFGVSFFLLLLTGETSPKSMVNANGSNLMEQHSLPSSSSSSLTRCCFSISPPPIAVAAAATKPDAVELSESLLKSSNDDEAVVDAVAAVEVAATGRFSTAMHVDPVSGIQWPGFHAIEIKKKKKKNQPLEIVTVVVVCGVVLNRRATIRHDPIRLQAKYGNSLPSWAFTNSKNQLRRILGVMVMMTWLSCCW